jgi:hypothetical protein
LNQFGVLKGLNATFQPEEFTKNGVLVSFPHYHQPSGGGKIVILIAMMCTTSCRNPASASQNQGPKKAIRSPSEVASPVRTNESVFFNFKMQVT